MLNIITVAGRLTRLPELKQTATGKSVVSFSIACDRDLGERETDFFNCTAWNKTAEFINKYFDKGSMIIINGRLQARKYKDKNGNDREAVEILVNNAYFGERNTSSKENAKTAVNEDFAEISDDNLPF